MASSSQVPASEASGVVVATTGTQGENVVQISDGEEALVAVAGLMRVHGHARGHGVSADCGRGRELVPVADRGRGHGHGFLLAGADSYKHYPRGFCPLPSLTTPLVVVVPAPDAMDDPRAPSAAVAVASSVMPAHPRAAKREELPRDMLELKEMMISLGLIPLRRPPPKGWWFHRLAGWFTGCLAWLWRLSLVDIIRRRREFDAADHQLVKNCLDHYNRQHPGNEYEPLRGNVTQNPHLHYDSCWVHGNFVARKKGSGVFSFLTAPRSVFFFELAYMDGFKGVVTCTTVEEPAYSVLGYPLWWATRTSGKLDSFCKTCYSRFGIPRPGIQKISACGHNNVVEVCEMCYCYSHTLHPDPGEFAFGYHHPYNPYPKR